MATDPSADISPDALNILLGQQTNRLAEQREANAAVRRRDEVAQRIAREQMTFTNERAQQVAQSADEQARILSEMTEKMERIDQIDDSFLLQIAEPVLGTFSDNFSRKRLAKDIQRDHARLEIEQTKDTLRASKLQAKVKQQQSELLAADARVALETGDVTALTSLLDMSKEARADAATLRQALLVRTDDAELANLRETAGVTERELQSEQQVRQSEQFQARQRTILEARQRVESQMQTVQLATPEQLRDPEFTKGLPQMLVKEELRSREMRQIADDMAKRANALIAASDEELQREAASGSSAVTPTVANRAIRERKAEREESVEAARQRKLNRAKQSQEAQLMLQQSARISLGEADIETQQQWLRDSLQTGVVDIGDGRLLRTEDIQTAINTNAQAMTEIITGQTVGNITETSMRSVAETISRSLGLPDDTGDETNADGLLTQVVNSRTTSPAVRTQADIVRQQLLAVQQFGVSGETQQQIQERLVENSQKLQTMVIEEATRALPKSVVPAVREFMETGQIKTATNAQLVIASAVGGGETTGAEHYDKTLTDLRNSVIAVTGSDTTKNARTLLESGSKTVPEMALSTLAGASEAVLEQLASPIVGTFVRDTHLAAARDIENPQLAELLRQNAPELSPNGSFSERAVFSLIEQTQGKEMLSQYVQRLRANADAVATATTTPQGPRNYIAGALNRVFFGDSAVPYLRAEMESRISRTMAGIREAERRANSGAAPLREQTLGAF